jgi:hypothetical protein
VGASLGSLSSSLGAYVRELEPERMANDAVLAAFDEIVSLAKVAEAGRALLARVIDERGLHRRSGHLSAAHRLAASSGTTVGAAAATIQTGRTMSEHAELDAAFRAGELSLEQAAVIADAVAVDASAEHALLDAAKTEGLKGMRTKARSVKATQEEDRLGRYERQRRAACFAPRCRPDRRMVWGNFRLPPDDGARVISRIEAETDRVFREAHRAGRRDPIERYAAEALVRVVTGDAKPSSRADGGVMVLVSHDALRRGRVEGDELCVIPGIGDVPLEVPHRMLHEDAFLTGLLHDGERVHVVERFGRRPSAAVKSALVAQAVIRHDLVVCDEPGCDRTDIEWDHTLAYADGGATTAGTMSAKCRGHHRAKTVTENENRARRRRARTVRRAAGRGPAP